MHPIKIDHNIFSELLTKVFSAYVKSQGYSLSNLNNKPFPVVCDYGIPSLSKVVSRVKSFDTIPYFKELEAQGYVTQNGISYNLTVAGYLQGYKQKHYLRYFFRKHWKIYIPIFISILIVIVGTANYLK